MTDYGGIRNIFYVVLWHYQGCWKIAGACHKARLGVSDDRMPHCKRAD